MRSLRSQARHQLAIVILIASAPCGRIPAPPLLAIAAPVSDAEIAQVVIAAEIARQYVLDGRALAGIGIEAQRAAADQAFADPISLFTMEGVIGGSGLIQQSDDRHGGDIAS